MISTRSPISARSPSGAQSPIPSGVPSALRLQSIIFATDFSQIAEKAGRYAAAIARQFGADLMVAHTFVLTQAAMEVEAEPLGPRSAQRAELAAALELEARRLGEGLRSSAVLLEGEPKEQIPRLASRQEPSLIVLGTGGSGSLKHAMLGSTAEDILRSTPDPTITVGPNAPPCPENGQPVRRVLYAASLSPQAARGAALAAGMAEAFGAELDVLHVIHPEDSEDRTGLAEARNRFNAEVEAMVPRHAGVLLAPHAVIASGAAQARILEHIRDNAIDLLVLSLHKSSHLWLESRRSGAFSIIAHAACPVLTLVG